MFSILVLCMKVSHENEGALCRILIPIPSEVILTNIMTSRCRIYFPLSLMNLRYKIQFIKLVIMIKTTSTYVNEKFVRMIK